MQKRVRWTRFIISEVDSDKMRQMNLYNIESYVEYHEEVHM